MPYPPCIYFPNLLFPLIANTINYLTPSKEYTCPKGNIKYVEWGSMDWRRGSTNDKISQVVPNILSTTKSHSANGEPNHQQITDCWIWKPEPSGHYFTRSAYHLLQEETAEETLDEALVDLWKLKIPAKASIFAWRLIRDKLPTKANLRRRQI